MPAINFDHRGVYVTNTRGSAVAHGAPATEDSFVGIAIKQKGEAWETGFAGVGVIANSEPYYLVTKGEVVVDTVSGFARGDDVYIIPATGVLTETATANLRFGRVTEVAGGTSGLPTGKCRIDLDDKSAVAGDAF